MKAHRLALPLLVLAGCAHGTVGATRDDPIFRRSLQAVAVGLGLSFKVDPRPFVSDPSYDLQNSQIVDDGALAEVRRRIAEDLGHPIADFAKTSECTPYSGGFGGMHFEPVPDSIRARMTACRGSRSRVVIVSQPRREGEQTIVQAQLMGDDAWKVWVLTFDSDGSLLDIERVRSFQGE